MAAGHGPGGRTNVEGLRHITFFAGGTLAISILCSAGGCSDGQVRPADSERGVLSRTFQKGGGWPPHRDRVEWTSAIEPDSMGTNSVTIVLLSSSAHPHKTEHYRIVLDGKTIFKGRINVECRGLDSTRVFEELLLSPGGHVLSVHRARKRESDTAEFDAVSVHMVDVNVDPLRIWIRDKDNFRI